MTSSCPRQVSDAWLVGGLVATVFAFLFAVPAFAQTAPAISIVAIGDSNFNPPGVATEDKYPAQLEAALRAKGDDVSVSNMGIIGDTTTGVLDRLDRDVPEGTQIALVAIGVNDYALHRVDKDTIGVNLTEIVRRLRARGIEVLLFGLGDLDDPKCCGGKGIAEPQGALFYRNFQDGVYDDARLHVEAQKPAQAGRSIAGNGAAWHLNKAGNAIVVERTLPLVEQLIARVKAKAASAP